MPHYYTLGKIPHKRHVQFRKPDGGLYSEQLFSTEGFSDDYSLLYHCHPPTQIIKAEPQVEAAPVVPRSKMGVGTGYTVQLGVFSNYDNAKSLQQKLAAAGIQAHLETRVQLGPFKDKQEADEAYRKIKQMGLPAVLVGQ